MAFEDYKDRQYCFEELGRAREMWSSKEKFTPKCAERIGFALAGMYLYCPLDMRDMVLGALNECHYRAALVHGVDTMLNTPVI